MFVETPHHSESPADAPWDWREHCEGFGVDRPDGRVGWVEALERDPGHVVALLVRRHHAYSPTVRVPLPAVIDVLADHGRVVIADPALLRQLGAAPGSPGCQYRCRGCGCGCGCGCVSDTPARCSMYGARAWEALDGRYGL